MSSDYIESVLELAFDLVKRALDELRKPSPSELELATATILLFTGCELIIKARLVKEHWAWVFNDMNIAM